MNTKFKVLTFKRKIASVFANIAKSSTLQRHFKYDYANTKTFAKIKNSK